MLFEMAGKRWLGCVVRLAITLALATAVAGAARADTVTDENVAAMMQAAKTPADYQSLATYFTDEAKQATATAAQHQAMMDGMSRVTGKSQQVAIPHCTNLIKSSKAEAKEYQALATAYEKLASGGATPGHGAHDTP